MIDASLNIRRMAALDSEALADTFAAWHKPLSQFENYYLEQMLEKRLVLVALLGEKIIGYNTLIWESPYTHFWRRRIPEIVDLNVWPTYQRQGVGKALIDGNSLPNAPKWIANVTARYGIPTDNGGEYFFYTDWAYRSETNFFLYKSVEFTGADLLEGGVRAGYNWGNGKYEAAIFGRNITNQVRVTGGIDFNNLTGFINDPRTYGVQFKMTF